MSQSRKQRQQPELLPSRSSKTGGRHEDAQLAQQTVLSIWQEGSGLTFLPNQQHSANNTPSSASASYRQHQQQHSKLQAAGTQNEQQQKQSRAITGSALGKKTAGSLKQSFSRNPSQKQQHALIQSNTVHSALTSNTAPPQHVGRSVPPKSQTPGSTSHIQQQTGVANPNNRDSNTANFSCLIQKQLTSLNYGGEASTHQLRVSKDNTSNNMAPAVARTFEKIAQGNMTRNSGGNFALSSSDMQHLQGRQTLSSHSSVNLHKSQKGLPATSSQYRGSQPQQKSKIKAFKRIDGNHPSGANNGATMDLLTSQKAAMMSQVSGVSSSAVSRNSGKRPSSNFVSLGGQSKGTNANAEVSSQSTTVPQKPPESSAKFRQSGSNPKKSSIPSLRNSTSNPDAALQSKATAGANTGSMLSNTSSVHNVAGNHAYMRSSSSNATSAVAAGTKTGNPHAERLSSQRSQGKKNSMKVFKLSSSASRTREQQSNSSVNSTSKKDQLSTGNKNGGGAKLADGDEIHSSLNLISMKNQSNMSAQTPGRQSARCSSSHQKTGSSHAGIDGRSSPSIASNTAAEASYCPKVVLNSSQEFVLRNNQMQPVQKINTSANHALLLPGHLVQANGPSSMQASTKPIVTGPQTFLPAQSKQNIILSASFEKLNFQGQQQQQHNVTAKSGGVTFKQNPNNTTDASLSSQSQNNTIRPHQQILRQNATKMQNFVNGHITAQQQHGKPLPYGNLKVKKQGLKTTTSTAGQKHNQMTPQRIKKVKENPQRTTTVQDQSINGLLSKNGAGNQSKAQQYMRNSFMIKNSHGKITNQNKTVAAAAAAGSSVSPRSNSGKHPLMAAVVNLSRNTTQGAQAHTVNGFMPNTSSSLLQQQQSLNTTNSSSCGVGQNLHLQQHQTRLSPMSGLPQSQAQSFQNAKQKVQNMPKNLNVIAKSQAGMSKTFKQNQNIEAVAGQPLSNQQKLMIDKKTYEDLMNYLVKTECNRLKHVDSTTTSQVKATGPLIVSTPNHSSAKTVQSGTQGIVSASTPNLNHQNLQQKSNKSGNRGASPGTNGSRKQTVQLSNSTAASGKKSKAAILQEVTSSIHSTFQSQQPVRHQNNWQPMMTMNQTLSKQLAIELPAQSTVLTGDKLSAESVKQQHQMTSAKSIQQQQARMIAGNVATKQVHSVSSKSQVASVKTFVPSKVMPFQGGRENHQKVQMLKTTISQTSQSRDASLNSQKTNEQPFTSNAGGRSSQQKQHIVLPSGKQNFLTKSTISRNNLQKGSHHITLKGQKPVQSRNGGQLLSAITGNSKNGTNQNNNSVFSVSIKPSNVRDQTILGIAQASPNQTFVQQSNGRGLAKKTGATTSIPTKVIKARSLIRGAPGQGPSGGAKQVMNVLKRQAAESIGHQTQATAPQETLKNNYMQSNTADQQKVEQPTHEISSCPPKRPSGGGRPQNQAKNGLKELQLKALNLPIKDRVQSAKSSSTNAANNSGQNIGSQKAPSFLIRGGSTPNNGAQSHRESQRYLSRPQDDASQPPLSTPGGHKIMIKQSIDRPRSRSKLSGVNPPTQQSQGSKERKRSKQIVDSHSKESRKSRKRHSNSSARGSKASRQQHRSSTMESADKKQNLRNSSVKDKNSAKSSSNVTAIENSKKSSLVGMLPLDIMAGPTLDDLEGSAGAHQITDGVHLSDTIVLKRSDICAKDQLLPKELSSYTRHSKKDDTTEVKDSCDLGADDALESMVGGNFNTFGEHQYHHAQNATTLFQDGKNHQIDLIGGEPVPMLASSTKLIEQIEHQIEQELMKEDKQALGSNPMFEINEQQSVGTHESNTIEQYLAKPPQNSMIENSADNLLLMQTIKSKQDSQQKSKEPHSSKESRETYNIKDFHYSGSFGIPNGSGAIAISGGGQQTMEVDDGREMIQIAPTRLYKEVSENDQNPYKVPKQQMQSKAGKGNSAKSKFELCNMSFSQENGAHQTSHQSNNQTNPKVADQPNLHASKNPHNTIVDDIEQTLDEDSLLETYQRYLITGTNDKIIQKRENSQEKKVAQKLYSDSEYRRQLLLRVLPDFEKLEQFDQLHNDFVNSTHEEIVEGQETHQSDQSEIEQMAVSRGAAQLLRQINLSLGRESTSVNLQKQNNHIGVKDLSPATAENDLDDDLLETNTVVENECDSEQQYLYAQSSAVQRDFSSPSVTSDRQVKSFETTSIHSPQNQTCIEIQTPSNQTSALQSHQASQNTTNLYQYSCEEETRLTLLQSSEPESHRKQGGAFAHFSPRTAAIYEDGANGGKQAIIPDGPNSLRHSKQMDEESTGNASLNVIAGGRIVNGKDLILPRFGLGSGSNLHADHDEEEAEEEDQSFQTMLVEGEEAAESLGGGETTRQGHVTSFYGPEQPQYEEIVSIMQADACAAEAELLDEQTYGRIDRMRAQLERGGNLDVSEHTSVNQVFNVQMSHDDNDTGGGSVAASHSPHSIRKVVPGVSKIAGHGSVQRQHDQEDDDDDDQFQFAENLNKQYADAMEQRRYLKMLNRPRQNSC